MSTFANSKSVGKRPSPQSRGVVDAYVEISIDRLKSGVKTQAAILDGEGRLLLAAGFTIATSVLLKLRQRGISRIRVHRDDLARLTGEETATPTQRRPAARGPVVSLAANPTINSSRLSAAEQPFRNRLQAHGAERYNPSLMQRCVHLRHTAENMFHDLLRRATGIGRAEQEQLSSLSHAGFELLAADCDAFVSGSLRCRVACDENRRDVVVRCRDLACSIAVRMDVSTVDLVDLNLGITLYHLGTLDAEGALGAAARDASASPESVQRSVMNWLGRSIAVSSSARLVALQMDERFDGSGGPRRLIGSRIHPLARIAAVARAYVELAAPTVDRKPVSPYEAVTFLLKETHRGRFDPNVTRAFLHAASLFPVGSCCQLSDGSVGRVLRSRDTDYTRPIVEAWLPGALDDDPRVVDLSRVDGVTVTRALQSLTEAVPSRPQHRDPVSREPVSWEPDPEPVAATWSLTGR